MDPRSRWNPEPVHHATGDYSTFFPDKWRDHNGRHRRARLWRLARGTVDWTRLPPHRDPKHPRGLLVGHSRAVPELRAYLGFESIGPDPIWYPADRLFLDTSCFATDPTDDRPRNRGRDLHYRRKVVGGLGVLVQRAEAWFACREDSRYDYFATPEGPRWKHPIP